MNSYNPITANLFEFELEADGEQQHQHAEIGEIVKDRSGIGRHTEVRPDGLDKKAGSQKADKRRKTYLPKCNPEDERSTHRKYFEHQSNSLRSRRPPKCDRPAGP